MRHCRGPGNKCGGRVTVRDLSYIGPQPRNVTSKLHLLPRVNTPLLDKILAKDMPLSERLLKAVADHWVMILVVAILGGLGVLLMGHR